MSPCIQNHKPLKAPGEEEKQVSSYKSDVKRVWAQLHKIIGHQIGLRSTFEANTAFLENLRSVSEDAADVRVSDLQDWYTWESQCPLYCPLLPAYIYIDYPSRLGVLLCAEPLQFYVWEPNPDDNNYASKTFNITSIDVHSWIQALWHRA